MQNGSSPQTLQWWRAGKLLVVLSHQNRLWPTEAVATSRAPFSGLGLIFSGFDSRECDLSVILDRNSGSS